MPYETKNRSDWYQAAFQINICKFNFTRFYLKSEDSTSNSFVSGWSL